MQRLPDEMMLETFKSKVLPLKNKLFRYAFSILEDHELSKDVVQETLIKVWEKRSDLEMIKKPEAWCMTLTRNFALDKFRSKHSKSISLSKAHDIENMELTPYHKAEMGDTMDIVERLISQLPEKQRETFQLREVEGLSYREISKITGYNLNDVKVSIFRSRKSIRTLLLKLQKHGLEKSTSAS
ncbi:MAG: RNA polymerase sigma factor [Cytophagales bacterium]|nr:RNA polymerase sigma factor [Cytophagales bacterium]